MCTYSWVTILNKQNGQYRRSTFGVADPDTYNRQIRIHTDIVAILEPTYFNLVPINVFIIYDIIYKKNAFSLGKPQKSTFFSSPLKCKLIWSVLLSTYLSYVLLKGVFTDFAWGVHGTVSISGIRLIHGFMDRSILVTGNNTGVIGPFRDTIKSNVADTWFK